jgi:hypothetical protein
MDPTMRRLMKRFAVVLALPLLGAACGGGDGKVREAIDQLRAAPPEDVAETQRRIDALAAAPASTPAGKRAQDACAKAYTSLVSGRKALAEAKATDSGDALAKAIGATRDAESQMAACNQASAALEKALRW